MIFIMQLYLIRDIIVYLFLFKELMALNKDCNKKFMNNNKKLFDKDGNKLYEDGYKFSEDQKRQGRMMLRQELMKNKLSKSRQTSHIINDVYTLIRNNLH